MRGRKNGCPTNIRDWQISILDKGWTAQERWVRIRGLRVMSKTCDSETADGSAATDLWEEPYVTKRSAVLKLSGKTIANAATGEKDEGQVMLDAYAAACGCAGDATIKFVDPYGHAMAADFVVTGAGQEANDTACDVSWELKQVGEAETLPYVAVSAVSVSPETLSMQAGDEPIQVSVGFAPENASNRRFRVSVTGRQYVQVSDVTENGFAVTALMQGTATVTVTSLNGQKTAQLTVNVGA